MPNWSDPGDDDCGCTMGKACAFHAAQNREERERENARMRAEGWVNPDAQIPGDLLPFLFELDRAETLSEAQKKQIRTIVSKGLSTETPPPSREDLEFTRKMDESARTGKPFVMHVDPHRAALQKKAEQARERARKKGKPLGGDMTFDEFMRSIGLY